MASRERDDAMAGLLKRSLAGDASAGNGCPQPDILAAYFERSLDAEETARVEIHLAECARCREEVAALARAEAEAPAAPVPDARRTRPRASWLWDWRWLAPVAAVLLITAIWATRRPALTNITGHVMQAPISVTPSEPAQPVPPPPAPAKKAAPSLVSPRPSGVPTAPMPSQRDSTTVNSAERVKPETTEVTPQQNLQSTQPIANLPLSARNYQRLETVPKKAPPEAKPAANAPNAPPGAVDESVTVESQAETVQPAAGAGAPMPPKTQNGALDRERAAMGGVAGGALSAGANAKQEPTAANRLDMAQVVATTQEQRTAGFTVPTPDKNVMWRIGASGFVERSTDAGATWLGTLPKQNAHYNAGSAPSADVCWIVGSNGVILLTQDGSRWQTIPPPQHTDFVAVTARDAWTATVTRADGRKFTTSDQGATWTAAK